MSLTMPARMIEPYIESVPDSDWCDEKRGRCMGHILNLVVHSIYRGRQKRVGNSYGLENTRNREGS